MKNLKLFPLDNTNFGQPDLVGKRKLSRPFSPSCPLHLILKAKCAVFKIYEPEVKEFIEKYALKWDVQVYDVALNWDHGHLLVQAPSRHSFNSFVRNLTSAISRLWGHKGLFEQRPYTRLIKWGRDFEQVKRYLALNQIEARGYSKAQARLILKSQDLGASNVIKSE